jgi:hypothetical protein
MIPRSWRGRCRSVESEEVFDSAWLVAGCLELVEQGGSSSLRDQEQ